METKQCPYCGEEIMKAAKKCRHCGEWLPVEQTKTAPSNTQIQSQVNVAKDWKELPNAGMLQLACWITWALEFISTIQNYDSKLDSFLGSILQFFADNIPDWIILIALGIMWFILIMGLRTYCQIRNIGKMPFIALVCLMVGAYLITLTGCFVEDEDLALLCLILFAFPLIVALSILELIIGIKLHKSDSTRRLGVWFMIYAIIPIVAMIVELGLWSGETQMIVTSIVEFIITTAVLHELAAVFGK